MFVSAPALRFFAFATMLASATACATPTVAEEKGGSAAALSENGDADGTATSGSAPSGSYVTTASTLTQSSLVRVAFTSSGCSAVQVNPSYLQASMRTSITLDQALNGDGSVTTTSPAKNCSLDADKGQLTVTLSLPSSFSYTDKVFSYKVQDGGQLLVNDGRSNIAFSAEE